MNITLIIIIVITKKERFSKYCQKSKTEEIMILPLFSSMIIFCLECVDPCSKAVACR
jgi:hypothetical protein